MSAIKSKLASMKIKADNYDNLLSDNKNYQSKIYDLENINQELTKQNQILQNDILKISGDKCILTSEKCILTNKIKFLENSVDNKTIDYYKKIEHIISSYESKINNLPQYQDEYNTLLKSFNDLKIKYETNCKRTKHNFDFYTSILNEKDRVISSLNNYNYTNNINQLKNNNLMNEIKQLNNEKDLLADKISNLTSIIDDYKDKIYCSDKEIKMLNQEVNKLELLIEKKDKSYEMTYKRNTVLQDKCTKLVNDNILYLVNTSKEINSKNDLIEKMEKDILLLNTIISRFKKYLNSIGVCDIFDDSNKIMLESTRIDEDEEDLDFENEEDVDEDVDEDEEDLEDVEDEEEYNKEYNSKELKFTDEELNLNTNFEIDDDIEKAIYKNIENLLSEWNLVKNEDYS